MIYHELEIGGVNYKLRLTAYNVQKLEKEAGKPLLDLIGDLDSITELMRLFRSSLSGEHKKLPPDKVAELFDEYVDDGGDYQTFMSEMMEVMAVSGFLPRKRMEEIRKKMVEAQDEPITQTSSEESGPQPVQQE